MDPKSDQALGEDAQIDIKLKMQRVVSEGGPSSGANLEFAYWEQLFDKKKSEASGLGQKIREFLQQNHPDRLEEFTSLSVEAGLDDGEANPVETFLLAEPNDSELPLADLLPASLRKLLDRLVSKPQDSVADPLIALLNGLKALPDSSDSTHVRLVWDNNGARALNSAHLFGFLYGKPSRIAANLSSILRLEVDPELCAPERLRTVLEKFESTLSEGEEVVEGWQPLQLSLRTEGSSTPLIRFVWKPEELPGLILFAQLVNNGGSRGRLSAPRLDDWTSRALTSNEIITPDSDLPADGLTAQWATLAQDHLETIANTGITVDALGDYVAAWLELLREARETLIPQGSPLAELNRFTEYETAKTDDDQIVMLGTHPLRLRWLKEHLSLMSEDISDALAGELSLNSENDQLYFDKLGQLSPHGNPPIFTNSDELYTAAREVGLHEEYSKVQGPEIAAHGVPSVLDDASTDAIVDTLHNFIDYFPHKSAGLSLLLVTETGAASICSRLVSQLRKEGFKPSVGAV